MGRIYVCIHINIYKHLFIALLVPNLSVVAHGVLGH